jgi:quinol monooxygenase YgiN
MDELFLVVGLRAKPGKEEQLKRDLRAVVEPSRQEPGCLRYELFEDRSDSSLFVFIEH